MTATETTQRILTHRWPDALIGDVQSHGGKAHEFVLTETGWEPLSAIRSLAAERALREARARSEIAAVLETLSPEGREAVIRRLQEMFL